jgi:hypothetical protein
MPSRADFFLIVWKFNFGFFGVNRSALSLTTLRGIDERTRGNGGIDVER